jgi:hypothetical protein
MANAYLNYFISPYCDHRDQFQSHKLEVIEKPLEWQKRGLSYTATGYGKKIPTRWMVRFNGKFRRVYCAIYSNNGTCYIGKLSDRYLIDIYQ